MSCIIADVAAAGQTVTAKPTIRPLNVLVNGQWQSAPTYTTTADNNGNWSLTLPWPSESDTPSFRYAVQVPWVIILPNGTYWSGVVPQGVAGPLSLATLSAQYQWNTVLGEYTVGFLTVVDGQPGEKGEKGDQGDPGLKGNKGDPGAVGPSTFLRTTTGTPITGTIIFADGTNLQATESGQTIVIDTKPSMTLANLTITESLTIGGSASGGLVSGIRAGATTLSGLVTFAAGTGITLAEDTVNKIITIGSAPGTSVAADTSTALTGTVKLLSSPSVILTENPATNTITFTSPSATPNVQGYAYANNHISLGYSTSVKGVLDASVLSLSPPISDPTYSITFSAGGVVDAGSHGWAYSFVTPLGETALGPSAIQTVGTNQVAVITGLPPLPTDSFIRLYRTTAGTTTPLKTFYDLKDSAIPQVIDSFTDSQLGATGPVAPPAAPGTAMTATAVSGSLGVGAGSHVYAVTFLGPSGESGFSPTVSVVTTGTQNVQLTNIPLGPTGTTGRRIYRSFVNTTTPLHYLMIDWSHQYTTINDNVTTSFVDGNGDSSINNSWNVTTPGPTVAAPSGAPTVTTGPAQPGLSGGLLTVSAIYRYQYLELTAVGHTNPSAIFYAPTTTPSSTTITVHLPAASSSSVTKRLLFRNAIHVTPPASLGSNTATFEQVVYSTEWQVADVGVAATDFVDTVSDDNLVPVNLYGTNSYTATTLSSQSTGGNTTGGFIYVDVPVNASLRSTLTRPPVAIGDLGGDVSLYTERPENQSLLWINGDWSLRTSGEYLFEVDAQNIPWGGGTVSQSFYIDGYANLFQYGFSQFWGGTLMWGPSSNVAHNYYDGNTASTNSPIILGLSEGNSDVPWLWVGDPYSKSPSASGFSVSQDGLAMGPQFVAVGADNIAFPRSTAPATFAVDPGMTPADPANTYDPTWYTPALQRRDPIGGSGGIAGFGMATRGVVAPNDLLYLQQFQRTQDSTGTRRMNSQSLFWIDGKGNIAFSTGKTKPDIPYIVPTIPYTGTPNLTINYAAVVQRGSASNIAPGNYYYRIAYGTYNGTETVASDPFLITIPTVAVQPALTNPGVKIYAEGDALGPFDYVKIYRTTVNAAQTDPYYLVAYESTNPGSLPDPFEFTDTIADSSITTHHGPSTINSISQYIMFNSTKFSADGNNNLTVNGTPLLSMTSTIDGGTF